MRELEPPPLSRESKRLLEEIVRNAMRQFPAADKP